MAEDPLWAVAEDRRLSSRILARRLYLSATGRGENASGERESPGFSAVGRVLTYCPIARALDVRAGVYQPDKQSVWLFTVGTLVCFLVKYYLHFLRVLTLGELTGRRGDYGLRNIKSPAGPWRYLQI
jgi:hypothetical protein